MLPLVLECGHSFVNHTHGSILREVQNKARDERPKAGYLEKR